MPREFSPFFARGAGGNNPICQGRVLVMRLFMILEMGVRLARGRAGEIRFRVSLIGEGF